MSNVILLSVMLITLALMLYSAGVLLNWRARRLVPTYLGFLWAGIVADATATRLMALRTETIRWDLHTIAGYTALALMGCLAIYGTVALVRRREDWLTGFHRVAVPIWVVWVASYATGVYIGMQRVG